MKRPIAISTAIAAVLSAAAFCGAAELPDPGAVHLPGVDRDLLKPFNPAAEPLVVGGKTAGRVDWGRRVAVAEGRARQEGVGGQAKIRARGAARVVAIRNAAAIGSGIPVGINGTVGDLRNGTVNFEAFVKDMTVSRYRSERKNGATWWVAEAEIPLFGIASFAAQIYDEQLSAHEGMVRGLRRTPWAPPLPEKQVAGDVVVIDARRLTFRPTMFPLLTDDDDRIVCDMKTAGKTNVCRYGLCGYATTKLTPRQLETGPVAVAPGGGPLDLLVLAAVKQEPPGGTTDPPPKRKTGRTPRRLVFRAVKTRGTQKAGLVVSKSDAKKITTDPRSAALFKKGRVLVIVDAPAAGLEGRRPFESNGDSLAIK